MLKAQMLATALDVYFSDPALGANKIDVPAPIGGAWRRRRQGSAGAAVLALRVRVAGEALQ